MAITIDKTELTAITRPDFAVSDSITASKSLASEVLTNVTATIAGHPDLVITDGTSSVTIGGELSDPFEDVFTYVDDGESDKTMTPVVVSGIPNVPENKKLYDLAQDMTDPYTITYTVTVSYTKSGSPKTATFEVTQDINNEFEGIRSFMDTYYD